MWEKPFKRTVQRQNPRLPGKPENTFLCRAKAVLLILVLVQLALAIPATTFAGTVLGTVTNACSGSPISLTSISVQSGSTVIATGVTDKSGNYSITDTEITAGDIFRVYASHSGYGLQSKQVTIPKNPPYSATADFALVQTGMFPLPLQPGRPVPFPVPGPL